MKTLVISLLRIGDLIMHTAVIRWLQSEGHNVDVMINREARGLLPLMKLKGKVHVFDRQLVQYSVGEPEVPAESGQRHIENLASAINSEKYDLVLNITNNQFSARFMDLIEAKNKIGLNYKDTNLTYRGSGYWTDYLNVLDDYAQGSRFHLSDILMAMAGKKQGVYLPLLSETDNGQLEAFDYIEHDNYVCIQGLTSDVKKNWGLANWEQLCWLLIRELNVPIYVLCSPSERLIYESQLSKELLDKVRLCETSLEGAYSILKKSRLLISGDTAIKHMASALEVPTIELVLGSSKYFETGYYGSQGLLLINREICAPCKHSNSCSRDQHYCSMRIRPHAVAEFARSLLSGSPSELMEQANLVQSDCDVRFTGIDESGFWYSVPAKANLSFVQKMEQIERSVWKYYLANDSNINLKMEALELADRFSFDSKEVQELFVECEEYFAMLMNFKGSWTQESINQILNYSVDRLQIHRELEELKTIRDNYINDLRLETNAQAWLTGVRLRASYRIAILREILNRGEKNEKRSGTAP